MKLVDQMNVLLQNVNEKMNSGNELEREDLILLLTAQLVKEDLYSQQVEQQRQQALKNE